MAPFTLTREQRETLVEHLEMTFESHFGVQLPALDEDPQFRDDALRLYEDLKWEDQEEYTLTAPVEILERLVRRMLEDSERDLASIKLEAPASVRSLLVEHYGMDEDGIADELERFREDARSDADTMLDLRSACLVVLNALEVS